MDNSNKISVIIPLYNSEEYIWATLKSVLNQTYKNFEILLINDCSTDSTLDVVNRLDDSRIRYFENTTNSGIAHARNIGLSLAEGEFIAFLDHDDISLPQRFEMQFNAFLRNPHLGVCGTAVQTMGQAVDQIWSYPTENDILQSRMLFDCPFTASSVMVRSAAIKNLRFNSNYPGVDDYEMWQQISKTWELGNLPEILTRYRIHDSQYSSGNIYKNDVSNLVCSIQMRYLYLLGIEPNESEIKTHIDVGVRWSYSSEDIQIIKSIKWIEKIRRFNSKKKIFKRNGLKSVIVERLRLIYKQSKKFNVYAFWYFLNSPAGAVGSKLW